jgi:hypothetical protein
MNSLKDQNILEVHSVPLENLVWKINNKTTQQNKTQPLHEKLGNLSSNIKFKLQQTTEEPALHVWIGKLDTKKGIHGHAGRSTSSVSLITCRFLKNRSVTLHIN